LKSGPRKTAGHDPLWANQFQPRSYLLLALVLAIFPVLYAIAFTHFNGVNVLFWDELELPEFLVKVANGQSAWMDWFAQHNEHRLFFPRLVFVLLTYLTGFDSKAAMYVVLGLFLANLAILYLVFRKQIGDPARLLWFAPLGFLAFHLRQFDNLLWGFQLSFVLPMTLALGAFYLTDRLSNEPAPPRRPLWGLWAALCSFGASFSSAMGLLIAPILIVQTFLCQPDKRERQHWVVLFGFLTLLEWALYFQGFIKPWHHPSWSVIYKDPILFSKYFLACLGGVFENQHTAMACGAVLGGLFFWTVYDLWRNRQLQAHGVALGTAGFVLLTLLSIAVGRAGFGLEQGLASRYTSFTVYFYAALYLMHLPRPAEQHKPWGGMATGLVLAVISISALSAMATSGKIGRDTRAAREYMAYVLRNYPLASDEELRLLYPNSEKVRTVAEILARHRWNAFGNPSPDDPLANKVRLSQEPMLYFDNICYRVTEKSVVIDGPWALDINHKQAAGGVYLRMKGKYYPALYGRERVDVANHFKNSRYQFTGVFALLPRDAFVPGSNPLEIIVLTRDRKAYYVPRRVEIKL
jgi:hypothetical protein